MVVVVGAVVTVGAGAGVVVVVVVVVVVAGVGAVVVAGLEASRGAGAVCDEGGRVAGVVLDGAATAVVERSISRGVILTKS